MAITNTFPSTGHLNVVFTESGVSDPIQLWGDYDLSIAGVTSGGGSVAVQRCFTSQNGTYNTVKSYTADAEEIGSHGADRGSWYRFSCTYVGGTVTCQLKR